MIIMPKSVAPPCAVFSAMFVAVLMMAALLTMPALLGALARSYGLGTADLGLLAAIETLAYVGGTYLASDKPIVKLGAWVPAAGAAIIAGNLACMFLANRIAFIVFRPMVGMSQGIVFGYALKCCSRSANPDRNFGILTAALSTMMVIGFQVIGHFSAIYGARAVFVLYAGLAAIALACAFRSRPRESTDHPTVALDSTTLPSPLILLGLGAVVLSFLAQGSIWAFLERLGVAHGFALPVVTNALSVFAIVGIAGSLGAAVLPIRVPRAVALIFALLILLPGLYCLYARLPIGAFTLGCAIAGFYWNFTLSLQLGILAGIDPTGRGAVLGGMVSGIGSGLGPLLAGLLVVGTNFQPVGWFAAMLVTAGAACILVVNRGAIRTCSPLSEQRAL
jgi:predicted MFS family arabinose efflux permease